MGKNYEIEMRTGPMNTYFEIRIPVFWQHCPKNQTVASCPLRKFIKKDGTYKIIEFQNSLVPDTKDWVTVRNVIDKMHEICAQCKQDNILSK